MTDLDVGEDLSWIVDRRRNRLTSRAFTSFEPEILSSAGMVVDTLRPCVVVVDCLRLWLPNRDIRTTSNCFKAPST